MFSVCIPCSNLPCSFPHISFADLSYANVKRFFVRINLSSLLKRFFELYTLSISCGGMKCKIAVKENLRNSLNSFCAKRVGLFAALNFLCGALSLHIDKIFRRLVNKKWGIFI